MEYKDRFTRRHENGYLVYYSDKDSFELMKQLGLYEDFGLSPIELSDVLIQGEMLKPREEWDMDKIDRFNAVKKRIYEHLDDNRKLPNYEDA